MHLPERITAKFLDVQSLRQYFTIAEQILFSGTNMLASIVIVAAAGVSWFGIYSFMFVLAMLGNAFFATLILRQMTLEISTLSERDRRDTFIATLAMLAILFTFILTFTYCLILLLPPQHILFIYQHELIACQIFVFCYSFFDAVRQLHYVTDNHKNSFFSSLIYAVSFIFILLISYFLSEPDKIVHRVFLGASFSIILCLLFNRLLRITVLEAQWRDWKYVWSIFQSYYKQSRFRLAGMAVSWTQNQSFNPFLMLIAGPLVAGYFSLARLLVMPMAVVNQGLTSSAIPSLRRKLINHGKPELVELIRKLDMKNLIFSASFITILIIGHFSGLLNRFVPDYAQVRWFLLIWLVALIAIIHRFWISQYFVVSMQFKYLMNVSLIALAVSFSGMFIAGYILGEVHIALMFVIVGELVSIIMFRHERAKQLKSETFN